MTQFNFSKNANYKDYAMCSVRALRNVHNYVGSNFNNALQDRVFRSLYNITTFL